jgi:hypothetical protein
LFSYHIKNNFATCGNNLGNIQLEYEAKQVFAPLPSIPIL